MITIQLFYLDQCTYCLKQKEVLKSLETTSIYGVVEKVTLTQAKSVPRRFDSLPLTVVTSVITGDNAEIEGYCDLETLVEVIKTLSEQ